MSASLIKNAVISGHPAGTVINIYESERAVYVSSELRDLKIIIGKDVNEIVFCGCLLRNCDITSKGNFSIGERFLGANILLGCNFNDEYIESFMGEYE